MKKFDLSALLERSIRSPSSIQDLSIDYVQSLLDGDELPDPIHPLVQLMEVSSAHTAFTLREGEAIDRRNNPYLANTEEELFPWMREADYLNAYALPGKATINLILPRDEIVNRMVGIPNSKTKKIVIPRYTEFTISNTTKLTLLYPIEIRLLPFSGGTLQIVYNTEHTTDLQPLTTNMLEWSVFHNNDGRRYVNIEIPLLQVTRHTENYTLLENVNKVESLSFGMSSEERYYTVRAFHSKDKKEWTELKIAYDEIVHDIKKPTVIVRPYDRFVNWYIPAIYTKSGVIHPNIRIDVYSTLGKVNMPLSLLKVDNYVMKVGVDNDNPSLAAYSGGIADMTAVMSSTDTLRGGRDNTPFEELREAIIYRRNVIDIPITPEQIRNQLITMGFGVILAQDDITDRVYYATKILSSYGKDYYLSLNESEKNTIFNNGVASGIMRLQSSIEETVKYPYVYDNGLRCTISPQTLMSNATGMLELVPEEKYPDKLGAGIETQINYINLNKFLYTPFYYVMDATTTNYDLRAYYIDRPEVKSRLFERENTTTNMELSVLAYTIERTRNGYRLLIQTIPGEGYINIPKDKLHVQLAFLATGHTEYAHIPANFVAEEKGTDTYYYWSVDIETNYDFDSNNSIIVTNAMIQDKTRRNLPMSLNQDFYVIFGASNNEPGYYVPTEIDRIMGTFLMGYEPIGIIMESIRLKLGTELSGLIRTCRTLAGSRVYLTHQNDVLAVYDQNIYVQDPKTGTDKFEIKDGKMVRTIEHKKGDPKLDKDGNQIVLYRKGDPIYENGSPVVVSERPTLHFSDIFVVDGLYYFANDDIALNEKEYIPTQIVDHYLEDLKPLQSRLLPRTTVGLYPKTTVGHIDLLIDDNRVYRTDSQLSFEIKLTISKIGYSDPEYKVGLERLCIDTISDILTRTTVSIKDMISEISSKSDENLIGLEIHMYSNGKELYTYSSKDDSVRCTIRRIIRLNDEMKLSVREDITFETLEHDPINNLR